MSVFQPVDVRGPANRRKQLVQRLMQQQATHTATAGASRPLGSPGSRSGGHAQGFQHNNVLAAIMSKLGVQGPADADAGFGPHITQVGNDPFGSGHYVSPHEVAPSDDGTAVPIPGGPGATGNGTVAGTITSNPGVVGIGAGTYQVPLGETPAQPNLIALGGGIFYDPVQNQVIGGGTHPGLQM